jgi:hypothetical protein
MNKRKLYGVILAVAIVIAVGLLMINTDSVLAPILRTPEKENIPTSVFSPLTQQDEIQVFVAVIKQLRKGSGPTYILRTTDDRGGSHIATESNPLILSPSTQDGISAALSDLSPMIVLIDQISEIERDPMEKGGRLKDGGSVITLGNLKTNGANSVYLVAQAYRGSMDAVGYAYTVEKVKGVWTITGLSQIWIS